MEAPKKRGGPTPPDSLSGWESQARDLQKDPWPRCSFGRPLIRTSPSMVPDVFQPASTSSSVVFPAPLGPIRADIVPGRRLPLPPCLRPTVRLSTRREKKARHGARHMAAKKGRAWSRRKSRPTPPHPRHSVIWQAPRPRLDHPYHAVQQLLRILLLLLDGVAPQQGSTLTEGPEGEGQSQKGQSIIVPLSKRNSSPNKALVQGSMSKQGEDGPDLVWSGQTPPPPQAGTPSAYGTLLGGEKDGKGGLETERVQRLERSWHALRWQPMPNALWRRLLCAALGRLLQLRTTGCGIDPKWGMG